MRETGHETPVTGKWSRVNRETGHKLPVTGKWSRVNERNRTQNPSNW